MRLGFQRQEDAEFFLPWFFYKNLDNSSAEGALDRKREVYECFDMKAMCACQERATDAESGLFASLISRFSSAVIRKLI